MPVNNPVWEKSPNLILGIDPGFHGGIAVFHTWKPYLCNAVRIYHMPITNPARTVLNLNPKSCIDEKKVAEIIRLAILDSGGGVKTWAIAERAQSSPQMGVTSAFRYGEGYGSIKGVLAALGVPLFEANPVVWKTALGLSKDKRESIAMASRIFPPIAYRLKRDIKGTDGLAEAALLAYYGAQFLSPKKQNDTDGVHNLQTGVFTPFKDGVPILPDGRRADDPSVKEPPGLMVPGGGTAAVLYEDDEPRHVTATDAMKAIEDNCVASSERMNREIIGPMADTLAKKIVSVVEELPMTLEDLL